MDKYSSLKIIINFSYRFYQNKLLIAYMMYVMLIYYIVIIVHSKDITLT